MSQENVEAVRAVFAQTAKGDFSGWFTGLSDDVVFVTSREAPDAGTYSGEEARQWITEWVESFEGHSIEALDFIDADDKVVCAMLQRGRPRGSQVAVEGQWWVVMTFREGAVVRLEIFPERAEALEAAGLGE